jgi:hypothetical protein
MTGAIVSGLFALMGALIGVFIQRNTQHQNWLLEKRAEAFAEFLQRFEVSRREASDIIYNSEEKVSELETQILEAYEPTFIYSKIVRLFLSDDSKEEFSKLVHNYWSIQTTGGISVKKIEGLNNNLNQIQNILEANLRCPRWHKSSWFRLSKSTGNK